MLDILKKGLGRAREVVSKLSEEITFGRLAIAAMAGFALAPGKASADPVELNFGGMGLRPQVSSLRRIDHDKFGVLVSLLQSDQTSCVEGGCSDVRRAIYKLEGNHLVRISPMMVVNGLDDPTANEGHAVEVDEGNGIPPRLFAQGPNGVEIVEVTADGVILSRGFGSGCGDRAHNLAQSPFSNDLKIISDKHLLDRVDTANIFGLHEPSSGDLCVQLQAAIDDASSRGLTPEQAGLLEGPISLITRDELYLARAEGFAAVTRRAVTGYAHETFLLANDAVGSLRNLQCDASGRCTAGGGVTPDVDYNDVGGAVSLENGTKVVLVDHDSSPTDALIAEAHVFTVVAPAVLQEEVATESVTESRLAEADGDADRIPDFNADGTRRDYCRGRANPGEVDVSSPLSATTSDGIPDACQDGDLGYPNKVVEEGGSSIASNQVIEVTGGVINASAGQEIRYIHSALSALDAQPSHTMQIASGNSFSIDVHDASNLDGTPGTLTISYNTFDDPFGDPVVVTLTGPGTWNSGRPVIGATIVSSGTDYTVHVGTEGWVVPNPDAGTSVPDAGTSSPDGGYLPDAVTPLSDSVTHLPDAEYLTDAVVPLPDAVMPLPDAVTPLPDSATIPTDGGFLPDAVTPLPDSIALDDAGKEGESESEAEGERNDGGVIGTDSSIEQPTPPDGCGGCNAGNDTPAGIQSTFWALLALALRRRRKEK